MNLTELAHWRYRIPALQTELDETNHSALGMARLRLLRKIHEGGNAQIDPPGQVETELHEKSDLIRWLLEEAKYKVQVGELENA